MNKPSVLQLKHVLEPSPKAPFNFDATMHKPGHFPSADNAWQPGTRWQTMLWQGQTLGLRFDNHGTTRRPALTVSVWSTKRLSQPLLQSLTEEITYRHCLEADLAAFDKRFEKDARLGPVTKIWKGMRPVTYSSLYEYLIIAIVLQNATVRRSVNMMQALFERYGTLLAFDGKELYCFWEPETIGRTTEQELRDLKLGYRARSIKRVTQAFLDGQIDEIALRTKTVDEQRQALLGLYGIGPASVGYILFDVFHRWDELSHISPWEQRIYSKLIFDRDPDDPVPVEDLMAFFERRFAGFKMLAVNYLWEDLFWKHRRKNLPWLEKLIRL